MSKQDRGSYRYLEAKPLARMSTRPSEQRRQRDIVLDRVPVVTSHHHRRPSSGPDAYIIAEPVSTAGRSGGCSPCCSPSRKGPTHTPDGYEIETARVYVATQQQEDPGYEDGEVVSRGHRYDTESSMTQFEEPEGRRSPESSRSRHRNFPYVENMQSTIERTTVADSTTQVVTTDEVTRTVVKSDNDIIMSQTVQPRVSQAIQSQPRVSFNQAADNVRRRSAEDVDASSHVLDVWTEELDQRPVYSLPHAVEEHQPIRYLKPSKNYNRRRGVCETCRRNCSIS